MRPTAAWLAFEDVSYLSITLAYVSKGLNMKRLLAMTLVVSACCSLAPAQTGRGRPGGRPPQVQRGGGPGSPGSTSLQRAGLKIGQAVPNLSVFDEQGGVFRLADLKGKYSVIVFGCLT